MSDTKQMITAVLGLAVDGTGRFLLTQRNQPNNIDVHLKWQFPGGGMEFGESPETTLKREMREELGVAVELLDSRPLVKTNVWPAVQAGHEQETHVTILVYLVNILEGNKEIQLDEETYAYRWFSPNEALTLDCLPLTKEFLEEAVQVLNR